MKKSISDKLIEVIKKATLLDKEIVLYVKTDWSPQSDTEGYLFDPEEIVPLELNGVPYFLEIDTVIEVIETWNNWTDGNKSDLDNIVEAVIYYAKYDAYKPV
ncbi:hypothetical protein D0C36_17430 [Mucilaginibacter conchicola]|uniref:DUF7716 domain-containing protein n=1 Tax=Mucilaginibacter conchicola TaxID=2303333 RepID=A0A372NP85_9SPHI|nr:hypothetical protein [Mucilaginibacter conchicola]RFZ90742.1 hypothetical protein D0C36_17430 [Mucilaginibacter conchicola]